MQSDRSKLSPLKKCFVNRICVSEIPKYFAKLIVPRRNGAQVLLQLLHYTWNTFLLIIFNVDRFKVYFADSSSFSLNISILAFCLNTENRHQNLSHLFIEIWVFNNLEQLPKEPTLFQGQTCSRNPIKLLSINFNLLYIFCHIFLLLLKAIKLLKIFY